MKHTTTTKHVNSSKLPHTVKAKAHHGIENTYSFIDSITKKSEKVLNDAEQQMQSLMDYTTDYRKSVEHYVKKNPLKTVGFATAGGAILALIWRAFKG